MRLSELPAFDPLTLRALKSAQTKKPSFLFLVKEQDLSICAHVAAITIRNDGTERDLGGLAQINT